MFDFFKSAYLELHSVDTNAVKKQDQKTLESEKSERAILSQKGKVLLRIFDGIFLLWLGGAISIEVITGVTGGIVKYIFLSLLTISSAIFLCFKNKKAELAAIICMVILLTVSILLL